jgi:hypothetical protein
MRRMPARYAALSLVLTLTALPCHAAPISVEGAQGIVASIDAQTGRYEVRTTELGWAFAGTLGAGAAQVTRPPPMS